jgi:hypothetical protein
MKSRFAVVVALGLALTQLAAPIAQAETTAAQFRAAAPQQFSADELQRYGLDSTATERAMALQNQGYELKVLSEQEAQAYTAGITDHEWLLIGILAGVIVIAVAVID